MGIQLAKSSLEFVLYGLMSLIGLQLSFVITCLVVRQRRFARVGLCVAVNVVAYLVVQTVIAHMLPEAYPQWAIPVIAFVVSLPRVVLIAVFLAIVAVEIVLYRDYLRYEQETITPVSVKEAFDSLPAGICFFTTDGSVVMKNEMMDRLCYALTGDVLKSGTDFMGRLSSGSLASGCAVASIEDSYVVTLPDGQVVSISVDDDVSVSKNVLRVVRANDVTDEYAKIRKLQEMVSELTDLNARLGQVNTDIVSTIGVQETVNARIKIHDELGNNLLVVEDFIKNGGSEEKLDEIRDWLTLSVSFLLSGFPDRSEDDYELLRETAEKLSVKIVVSGKLPESEPLKHIVSTAIHECLTNTIRHAHGDMLEVEVDESRDRINVTLTNNGDQPTAPIRETGGLLSLRELVERAGGSMTVVSQPSLSITVSLPKGVSHEL